ncbi:MAG: ATP-binding cassette domain-containing protein [Tissierellia bacterium]|nr:ATP-binding cassette domain-containing protein [Tissierellia bacterium]
MNTEYILETKGLSKEFRGQRAVDGVSLKVRRGTVYGLLGPNGAGKSTLLKMLVGMARPSGGQILYRGRPWSRRDLAQMGGLIESPPIYGNLTARENLRLRGLLLGLTREREEEVLELVGLEGTGRKKSRQFSLGMKQRLGIALALLHEPQLLILDEPTNGLDPLGMEELRALIGSLPREGITVILSSHYLGEVARVAQDVAILQGGRLEYEGPLESGANLEEIFMEQMRGKGALLV